MLTVDCAVLQASTDQRWKEDVGETWLTMFATGLPGTMNAVIIYLPQFLYVRKDVIVHTWKKPLPNHESWKPVMDAKNLRMYFRRYVQAKAK